MAKLVLGRYVAYDSFLHRLDARNKIICLIFLIVAIFLPLEGFELNFLIQGVLAFFIFFLMIASKIRISDFFKSLKALWIMMIILFIINIFIPGENKEVYGIAFNIGIDVYWASIFQSLKIIIRLVLMISLTLILTETTKPLELTFAFEWFFTPLKIIGFPAHIIAMTLSIALRFIPTLLDETERIMKAQTSRGVDFKRGKIKEKMRAIVSLIVPLFASSFERSEQLADAMEARGYDPKGKRTRYRISHFSFYDLFSFIISGALMGGVIVLSVNHFTYYTHLLKPWLLIIFYSLFIIMIIIGVIFVSASKKRAK